VGDCLVDAATEADNKGVNMSTDEMEEVFDKEGEVLTRLGAMPPLYILLIKKKRSA